MYFYMHTCIRTHVDIYKCGIYGIYVCMYMYMGGCSIVNNTNNTLVSDTPTPHPRMTKVAGGVRPGGCRRRSSCGRSGE